MAIVSDAWGNSKIKPLRDFGKIDPSKEVKISFGNPIMMNSSDNNEHQRVLDFIKTKFIEWDRKDSIIE